MSITTITSTINIDCEVSLDCLFWLLPIDYRIREGGDLPTSGRIYLARYGDFSRGQSEPSDDKAPKLGIDFEHSKKTVFKNCISIKFYLGKKKISAKLYRDLIHLSGPNSQELVRQSLDLIVKCYGDLYGKMTHVHSLPAEALDRVIRWVEQATETLDNSLAGLAAPDVDPIAAEIFMGNTYDFSDLATHLSLISAMTHPEFTVAPQAPRLLEASYDAAMNNFRFSLGKVIDREEFALRINDLSLAGIKVKFNNTIHHAVIISIVDDEVFHALGEYTTSAATTRKLEAEPATPRSARSRGSPKVKIPKSLHTFLVEKSGSITLVSRDESTAPLAVKYMKWLFEMISRGK